MGTHNVLPGNDLEVTTEHIVRAFEAIGLMVSEEKQAEVLDLCKSIVSASAACGDTITDFTALHLLVELHRPQIEPYSTEKRLKGMREQAAQAKAWRETMENK